MDRAALIADMALEIEKKYRLTADEWVAVRAALDQAGAENLGSHLEENVIYGGGVLDGFNGILRVRRTDTMTTFTLKQRIEDHFDVKQQIENETQVANGEALDKILAGLGFRPRLIYEKNRETWRFRRVEIVLDELPFGCYMEIEGSIAAIEEAESLLDIDGLCLEHLTYPQLTTRFGSEIDNVIECRFARNDQP